MRYVLEPEVSGELGVNTIIDRTEHPPTIHHLHFVFKGWLGDELIECFPCYLVSEALGYAIVNGGLSGFSLETAQIEVEEQFYLLHPATQIPTFIWLKIEGVDDSDFSLNAELTLSVSEEAYSILSGFRLNNCDIDREY